MAAIDAATADRDATNDGSRLTILVPAWCRAVVCRRAAPVQAKYGEESRFFDLQVRGDISGNFSNVNEAWDRCCALPVALSPTSDWLCSFVCFSQDLENTIGSWDMYGQEDKNRYNSLQVSTWRDAQMQQPGGGACNGQAWWPVCVYCWMLAPQNSDDHRYKHHYSPASSVV